MSTPLEKFAAESTAVAAAEQCFCAASHSVKEARDTHDRALRAAYADEDDARVQRQYRIAAAALVLAVDARDRALLAVYGAKDAAP